MIRKILVAMLGVAVITAMTAQHTPPTTAS